MKEINLMRVQLGAKQSSIGGERGDWCVAFGESKNILQETQGFTGSASARRKTFQEEKICKADLDEFIHFISQVRNCNLSLFLWSVFQDPVPARITQC